MAGTPWHKEYERRRDEVVQLRKQYEERCEELGANPRTINEEIRREMIARIVHESNWQEDLYLDPIRTRELADAVFDDPIGVKGPHIDFTTILQEHRNRVIKMKRQRKSREEIAAYNLSRAHEAIQWVVIELGLRSVHGMFVLTDLTFASIGEKLEQDNNFRNIRELRKKSLASKSPLNVPFPVKGDLKTHGEWASETSKVDWKELMNPMKVDYLHFLHRITMMGLLGAKKCGSFRKTPVHIPANPDLFFPPAGSIRGLMEEYCNDFDTLSPFSPIVKGYARDWKNEDLIKEAASLSHRFVRIHPYSDGNGRMSRLIMNMVLFKEYPPVYIKADKKGRHRYVWALKKADRGYLMPLSCLIAASLQTIYKRLLDSVSRPK